MIFRKLSAAMAYHVIQEWIILELLLGNPGVLMNRFENAPEIQYLIYLYENETEPGKLYIAISNESLRYTGNNSRATFCRKRRQRAQINQHLPVDELFNYWFIVLQPCSAEAKAPN